MGTSLSADVWLLGRLVFWMGLVYFFGKTLAVKGDALGKATGLGGSWVGLVFLACATSMPEMITGIVTAGVVKAPDLALGNIFGSCLFNLAIIAVLDFFVRDEPVLRGVRHSQILPCVLGILMIGIGTAGVWLVSPGILPLEWGWGFGAALVIAYVLGVRLLYSQSQKRAAARTPPAGDRPPVRTALAHFALWSVFLIVTAVFLSYAGDEVSAHTFTGGIQVGKTFVGTFLLAAATSLPELSVSIQAARIGAPGMAVGNVLGSNLFNLAVVPICQVAAWFGKAPAVLHEASWNHLFTGGITIALTGIVLYSILRPPRRKVGSMGIESVVIAALYLLATVTIFLLGRGQ